MYSSQFQPVSIAVPLQHAVPVLASLLEADSLPLLLLLRTLGMLRSGFTLGTGSNEQGTTSQLNVEEDTRLMTIP